MKRYLHACEACQRVKRGQREKKGRGGWLPDFVCSFN